MLGRQQRVGLLGLTATAWRSALSAALAVALAVAVAALATGCGSDDSRASQEPTLPAEQPLPDPQPLPEPEPVPETDEPQPDTGDLEPEVEPQPKPQRRSGRLLSAADRRDFERLEAQLGGQGGVAVSSVGFGARVAQAGSLRRAVAWSTSKVPVTMAVYAAGLGDSQQANATAAITASDNQAAQAMWDALGSGQQAAQATDGALRAAGDQVTVTQPDVLRSGFTAFGQTDWALADQTRFVAGMPCLTVGQQVLDLMGRTVPAQRWGLGQIDQSAQIKGGWGPGSRPGQAGGGYIDRQMGIVTLAGKPMAVSIIAAPADGSHETGTRNLTRIAQWAAEHVNPGALRDQPRC